METTALRQALLSRLGTFPRPTALAPLLEAPIDEGEYSRVRMTYEVEAGERIAAWLLIPKGPVPQEGWPAILAIHQHAGQFALGKSELVGLVGDPMYAYGRDLCLRGYLVLCPDLLCFEERRPSNDAQQTSRVLEGERYERFEFTSRLLTGSCLQTKYLHDLSCAVDALVSLPEVNQERLGAIGHSLGGQETLWLTWYDPRIAAAVSSCGFGLFSTLLHHGINHNFAAYIPGMLDICDMDALVMDLAPRAFLLTAGESDPLFPIDGVRSIVEKAHRHFSQQGLSEHFQALLFPAGHCFPDEVKAQAYAFLDRWLK